MTKQLRTLRNLIAPVGIPLAWKQLASDRKRLVTAVVGVTFAIVLMLFQVGLYNAINLMVILPHQQLKGDLYLVSPDWDFFGSSRTFTRRRVQQIAALPEVQSATPVYMGYVLWTNPVSHKSKGALCIAFNPEESPFLPGVLRHQTELLRHPEAILFDRLSQSDYGPIEQLMAAKPELEVDVEHKRAVVRGLYSMGPTLSASANLIMSDEAWFRYRPDMPRNMANLGVITLRPGADVEAVAARVRDTLPNDVRVVTRHDFAAAEQAYWNKRTPVGFVVGAGMLVGMLVGAIVVYQILYSDVNDHLREYATLKAMGIADSFFVLLVLQEALILVALGTLPALGLTELVNSFARNSVNLPAYIEPKQVITVLGGVALTSLMAGYLATRRLRAADPASVF